MNDFLSILSGIWDFMKNNGFTFNIGETSITLTFAVTACGIFVISVVTDLIHKIWWEE